MILTWQNALANTRNNRESCRFPGSTDPRSRELVFPIVHPRFKISEGAAIFTIGSCFARHIEEKLIGFNLPTRKFSVPKSEWKSRANGLLNEYNPGTMSQRIRYAVEQRDYPDDTIVESTAGFCDLALLGGTPVTEERAVDRRKEIRAVYSELANCEYVIITLGLIETWYDNKNEVYLNRMPPLDVLRREGSRFEFRRLGLDEAHDLLDSAIGKLVALNKKILLTVSPVPLQTTFTGQDALIANEYSKSVLRICAQRLYERYGELDYFPSFEIVRMLGTGSFSEDFVHVRDEVVTDVIGYMSDNYVEKKIANRTARVSANLA